MGTATIAHWEVTRAKNAGQKPNPHGGQFDKWYIGLKNLDGGENCDDAYWQRKSPSEVEVGDKVFGKVEEGDYGDRFYLEKEEGYEASTGTSAPSQNSSKGQGNGDVDWDARNAEIRRQHSQEMAVRFTDFLARQVPEEMSVAECKAQVIALADWFDQDAIAAGQKASRLDAPQAEVKENPVDLTGARTEEPNPVQSVVDTFDATVIDDKHQFLEDRLVNGGAPTRFAGKLASYALEQLKPDDLKRLEALLNSHETLSEGARRLEASYVKAVGPIPPADDFSDLPFG